MIDKRPLRAFGVRLAFAAVLGALATPVAAQVGSPAGPVPPEFLEARRTALLERLDEGVAVLRSADVRSIEGDYPQDSDFRQTNEFFYLTGLETPDSWLVLIAGPGEDGRSILYLPPRNPSEERWTGPRLGPGEEASRITGIEDVRSAELAPAQITEMVGAPAQQAAGSFYAGVDPAAEATGSATFIEDLARHVAALRTIKDDEELRRLRRAIEITGEAQRAAMRAAEPGMYEYQLEALIEYTFRRRGAERVGFPSIVGSGPNSVILHYDRSRRLMEPGDLVVMDIGAEFGYYSADITRTIPVSGTFTPRQRELYMLVLGAQQAAIDAVRPGADIGRLTAIARSYLEENSGSLCEPLTCDRYFVHGLSHGLGMDVHDPGSYGGGLEPGTVFTIEPGIYIPEENLGIRIEDDILVTEDGFEILSTHSPRDPDEIEALMALPADIPPPGESQDRG